MLEKITDKIYYLMNQDTTDRPALGIVIGEQGCLIIDAGNSPKHAREFMTEIEKMDIPPVKYLVVTHHHYDHTFGLGEWNTIKIANQKTSDYMETYHKLKYDDASLEEAKKKGYFNEFSINSIKEEITDRDSFIPGNIDVTFKGELNIDLGGVTCAIKQINSPHTDDSTIIYVPEEKVLFLGDCAYGHSFQGYNYYNKNLLFPMIELIELYEADYYLCSHESVCTREEILDYWEKLRMGAEIAEKSNNFEEALLEYKKKYKIEPSDEDIFFIKSFGVGDGWGSTGKLEQKV